MKGQEQLQHRYPARVTHNQAERARWAIAMEYSLMSDEPEPSKAEPPTQGGVFGNLPDARPGTRSPRRASAAKAGGTAKAKAKPTAKHTARTTAKPRTKAKAKPAPKAAPVAKSPPPPPRAAEQRRPGPEQQPGGLADVAWAGIAVAAEAATIGVRLASRAIDAVRGNSERD